MNTNQVLIPGKTALNKEHQTQVASDVYGALFFMLGVVVLTGYLCTFLPKRNF